MTILLCFIGFAVGMGLSAQTSINGRLRRSVLSPFLTSFISFTVSTLFITTLVLATTDSIIPDMALFETQPVWIWMGGLFGLTFLTGNILLFPKLGAVQTVIFPVLGQIVAGLIIDQFGLFNAPLAPVSLVKAIGMTLVLAGVSGVVLFSSKKNASQIPAKQHGIGLWGWRLLGIMTGACSAIQIAVNGQLGIVLHSSLHAAFISFIVGVTSLFIIVCIQHPRLQLKLPEGQTKNPWWMWIGGFLGALYVIGNAFISPKIGTGTTVVFGLLGLMTAGLIFDQTGLLQSPKHPVCLKQIIALASMFAGVCIIRLLT